MVNQFVAPRQIDTLKRSSAGLWGPENIMKFSVSGHLQLCFPCLGGEHDGVCEREASIDIEQAGASIQLCGFTGKPMLGLDVTLVRD